MNERLDLVVFGASGFTGKYTVEEVHKLATEKNLTWGISGRSKDKLDSVLAALGKKLDKDFSNIEVILADVGDAKSLEAMAARARVVINCCGPYRHWGEQVVKACIASGTHQVDVSGEPQFMERIQLEYNEAAKQKGVYIISACGFDSIPADLGLVFLQQQFKGDLNSVEEYVSMKVEGGNPGGALIHYGTWESLVYGAAHMGELRQLRQKLFPERLPKMLPALKSKGTIFKHETFNKWCMPFLGSDRSVMQRSQRFFYENEEKRPVQVQSYIVLPSLFVSLAMMMFGALLFIMSKTSFGRSLLLNYPRIFSGGFVSHEGPSEEVMKKTNFRVTLVGEGWDESLPEPSDVHETAPNKRMTVVVKGTNPGYGATCLALVMSAITILKESEKLPGRGGVLPPGAAFAKTTIISELHKNGLTFDVVPPEK